ncbi:Kef-type K+ transport system membrane component KefB [Kitasatospora gansuensis]|uniref:Kef-type K+ transport system membrane component KefB n=1 Tax=Kitasatospora gansuensis TaxID=258050 RepID=A0A7W7SG68_9ACTN|nr:cation:proton antiporter [Kitasatospora gansuensis]MBB4949895.1 Kef-type K+ transport system membrane component KefB [Kitasatospora gansuensis]
MTADDVDAVALVLIPACAVAAPLLADRLQRWLAVPTVVFEIVLGVLIGPDVLGWAEVGDLVDALSQFGLAMLMFLAGYEIDFARLRGGPLKRAVGAWLVTLTVALGAGALINRDALSGAFAGLALTTTALGTILPILRDSGTLPTPFGSMTMATGAVGEFGPIIAIAVLLSGNTPVRSAVILGAFAVITAVAVSYARRPRPDFVTRLIRRTLRTSGQFAVRTVILVLAVMVGAAIWLSLDMLLGAFTAGIVSRLLLSGVPEAEEEVIEAKLEGIGFGFLVPIFFVVSGMNFDLDALLSDPGTLLLVPVFLLLLAALRGVPAALLAPPELGGRDRVALGLFGATALPLVVVITTIEVEAERLPSSTAAALVGAGMLSVLLFPLLAQRLRGQTQPPPREGRPRVTAESW